MTLVAPAYQVEQRKQKNPHNIDEMPVEPDDLNWREIVRREIIAPGAEHQPQQQAHADDHVNGVQSGHREVEEEINLRVFKAPGSEPRERFAFRSPIKARSE